MKNPRLLLLALMWLTMSAYAQDGSEGVNIRLTDQEFASFVQQVEEQSDLVLFYNPSWFEGRRFSYQADSVRAEDALYEVLKGTGLHFNRVGAQRLIILPERRLNMSLPVMANVHWKISGCRRRRGVHGSKG